MTDANQERVARAFSELSGTPPLMIRSPGRVNLMGEHTDYNLGFVLPAAVDKSIWLALAPRRDGRCRFRSADLGETYQTTTAALTHTDVHWANYLLGILVEMQRDGHLLAGVDCAFGGDIPIGSGMSSSAALECGFAFGLNEMLGLGYDRVALARLGQRSENNFVGVNCGIMDQFASLLGRDGAVIRLDCRDLTYTYAPFSRPDLRLVLCDTQVRRELATSEYNVRRAQCEAGLAVLRQSHPEVASLRDATLELLARHRDRLDPVVLRRCAYVVAENQRVLDACQALAADDFPAFGALMNASHRGLREEYQVSSVELDSLVDAAQAIPGVLGARMMGAGFGGCTINLVAEEYLAEFREQMGHAFRARLGTEPVVHICRLTGGTARID